VGGEGGGDLGFLWSRRSQRRRGGGAFVVVGGDRVGRLRGE
jgi:hypothetical protein